MEFVDSALASLLEISVDSRMTSAMKEQIHILVQDLASFNLFTFILEKLNDSSFAKNYKDSRSAEISCILATLEKEGLVETAVLALESGEFQDWNTLSSELVENIQIFKRLIKEEDCVHFSDCLSKFEFSRKDELDTLIDYTNVCLGSFILSRGDIIHDLDKMVKVESFREELNLIKKVFQFSREGCNSTEEMEDFKIHIQAWTCDVACFCLLNWVKDGNLDVIILLDLQRKLNAALLEVTRMSLLVLKASKLLECDTSVDIVSRSVDVLLRESQEDLLEDDIQRLRNGMLFLITFLMDPPEINTDDANDGKLILTQAAAAVATASLLTSLSAIEFERIAEKRDILLNFLRKENAIEEEVRKIFAPLFMDSSSFHFPSTNILGLFDSLIEEMKEITKSPSLHQNLKIPDELVLLRNLLGTSSNLKESFISKLQNEHNEMRDLWTGIVNMAHKLQRTITSFMYLENPVWIPMLCLLDITEEIKHIVAAVKRVNGDSLNTETNLSPRVLLQNHVQTTDAMVVGFEAEVKEILGWLTSGSKELDILSITGMPGMGKTTLAKMVYRNSSIKCRFTKQAWCTVSQSYNCKELLLDILDGVTEKNDKFAEMDKETLEDKVRKCLKGQKFLIVMDDIWDAGAWNALKLSFPDDNEGSRIIFTSRIHNMVLEAKSNCRIYPLSPLSEEESWELLENRLFYKDSCPPNFAVVGKQIAKDCKGLPLAIVLVAGLLKEQIESLDWWEKVGENLGLKISAKGCMNILERSYMHLPESLKPCFLYFGSFREDEVIRVQKLVRLWVSEGFIKKQAMKAFETEAEEYLADLVARSLVIVTERSSSGGIKTCQIHDLLWEFCLVKAKEENFLKVFRDNKNPSVSRKALDKHYRVCIQSKGLIKTLLHDELKFSVLHSLLFSLDDCFSVFHLDYWCIANSEFLEVLDLVGVKVMGEFPENITKLIHLRYIAFRCDVIAWFPPSIRRLLNLETLHVKRTPNLAYLPHTMWQMTKLRHVDVGKCIPPYLVDYYMPELLNIQSFSSPCLGCTAETRHFLRKIKTVRKLKCIFGKKMEEWEDGQILELGFLNLLESLNITCKRRNLGCFPITFPSNLKKLTLKGFSAPWDEISTIAKLPNLEVLKLLYEAFNGQVWTMEDGEFLKLKFLKLQSLDIEEWNTFDDEPFPCLEQLVVGNCRKLGEIPSAFGNIPALRKIQVESCSSTIASSVMQIREYQFDLGNEDLKVFIKWW